MMRLGLICGNNKLLLLRVQVTMNYAKGVKPTNKTATPAFRNILLEDVRCDRGGNSYLIDGLAEMPIQNLTLKNVTMSSSGVGKQAGCDYADCHCDALTQPCPSCCKRHTTADDSTRLSWH